MTTDLAEQIVLNKKPKTPDERLAVYRQAYYQRLSSSLSEDFSLTAHQMGAVKFKAVIQDFIHQNPSQFTNLAEYSQDFVKYLIQQQSEFYPIADLEWKLIQIEHLSEFQFYLIVSKNPELSRQFQLKDQTLFEYLTQARSFNQIESWLRSQNRDIEFFLSSLVEWISFKAVLVLEKSEL